MDPFLHDWHLAARTSTGLFWSAFWAFGLGYLISSLVQVFATRRRMRAALGDSGPRSVALGTLFGFVSSSCSFAALSTTRALFARGAGLVPSLAFLLASTNLVVELGIVIALFLSWQFVVAEYVGGLLLIGLMWVVVPLTLPGGLEQEARERARRGGEHADEAGESGSDGPPAWRDPARWSAVARHYLMEWGMVWKDVTVGFTVAGIVAAFVPAAFFETLFVGAGRPDPGLPALVAQSLVGPLAAFFTFIGSMGNIPLAAVLYENGVSFAGIMAFVFSDLVVFPVLRIQARYYGWRMALYVLAVFLAILVAAALLLHQGFALLDLLPPPRGVETVVERDPFPGGWKRGLGLGFVALTGVCLAVRRWTRDPVGGHRHGDGEPVLNAFTTLALVWLAGGWLVGWLTGSSG